MKNCKKCKGKGWIWVDSPTDTHPDNIEKDICPECGGGKEEWITRFAKRMAKDLAREIREGRKAVAMGRVWDVCGHDESLNREYNEQDRIERISESKDLNRFA